MRAPSVATASARSRANRARSSGPGTPHCASTSHVTCCSVGYSRGNVKHTSSPVRPHARKRKPSRSLPGRGAATSTSSGYAACAHACACAFSCACASACIVRARRGGGARHIAEPRRRAGNLQELELRKLPLQTLLATVRHWTIYRRRREGPAEEESAWTAPKGAPRAGRLAIVGPSSLVHPRTFTDSVGCLRESAAAAAGRTDTGEVGVGHLTRSSVQNVLRPWSLCVSPHCCSAWWCARRRRPAQHACPHGGRIQAARVRSARSRRGSGANGRAVQCDAAQGAETNGGPAPQGPLHCAAPHTESGGAASPSALARLTLRHRATFPVLAALQASAFMIAAGVAAAALAGRAILRHSRGGGSVFQHFTGGASLGGANKVPYAAARRAVRMPGAVLAGLPPGPGPARTWALKPCAHTGYTLAQGFDNPMSRAEAAKILGIRYPHAPPCVCCGHLSLEHAAIPAWRPSLSTLVSCSAESLVQPVTLNVETVKRT